MTLRRAVVQELVDACRRKQAEADGASWGRLVENAVTAHPLNGLQGSDWSIHYWRDGDAPGSLRFTWPFAVPRARAWMRSAMRRWRQGGILT